MPGPSPASALAGAVLAEFRGQDGCELRLPLADGFVTEDDAALQEHLAEILEREAVAQPPEHDQGDDIARILRPVQHPAAALIELPAAVAAAKAPIAPGGAVPPLRDARGAAADAFH